MSVEIRLKPTGLFKKKLSFDDILGDKLAFGVSDHNYCLVPDEHGEFTIVYDPQQIARGIEVSCDDNDFVLRLTLPTSKQEIELFYDIAEKICKKLKTDTFIRDDEVVKLSQIPSCIENDVNASVDALSDIAEKVTENKGEYFTIFGAMIPVSIGEKEIHTINNDINMFGDWLNEKQQLDAYYANPRVYKNENYTFGIYMIGPDILSIFPTKPYIIMNQIKGIEKWFVGVGGADNIVAFDDFVNAVDKSNYFDANHFLISLSEEQIADIASKYKTEL